MSSAGRPPRGFRGVSLWSPDPAELGSGTVVPAELVPAALSALTAPGTARTPTVGIVVLGRWLGAKPGDMAWPVAAVRPVGTGFEVVFRGLDGPAYRDDRPVRDDGPARVDGPVLRVDGPGDGVLVPGPYGDMLVIRSARTVLVTSSGEPPAWLPRVREGRALDMRGEPRPWPRRRPPGRPWPGDSWPRGLWPAAAQRVPALLLSIWWAGPLPAGLLPTGPPPATDGPG